MFAGHITLKVKKCEIARLVGEIFAFRCSKRLAPASRGGSGDVCAVPFLDKLTIGAFSEILRPRWLSVQKRHRSLELIVSELLVGELPSFFRRRVDIELFKSALDAAAAFALRQLGAHEGFGIALVVDDVCVGCAPKGVRDSLLAKAVLDEPLVELLARLLPDACKFQNLLEGL